MSAPLLLPILALRTDRAGTDDVAHTALSHVADQAYGRVVHEDDKDEFLATSGLLEILREHGFDPAYVLHEEHFSLLELPSPAICADRFDYGRSSLSRCV